MDIFAHAAISFIAFHWMRRWWLAILFGVLPDIMSWGVYVAYSIINGGAFGPPNLAQIPAWTFMLYGISHSLIVWGLVVAVLYFSLKKFPYYVLAAPLAISIDVLTHSRDFLPTPFLWPLSEWRFPGIQWGQEWFIVTYWTLIIIGIAAVMFYKYRKRLQNAGNKKR
ncbi:hypothetical protein GF342_01075 [Candidatus Woesearchaeota archaeon]|nr:hypothetical protein [Candidatus Woesearchaeota archaeon]